MIKINVKNLNLKDTITCGQIFRFEENNDSYIVILKDRVVRLKYENNILYVSSNDETNLEQVIRKYLDLDRDYESINKKLIYKNNELEDIINYSSGLKMIQQEPYETLISYIISANNRVSMISKVVDNISKKYGKKVMFENCEYYLFPNNKEMKDCTKEILRSLKTGFRDEYIYEVVNKINRDEFNLDSINNLSTKDALEYLMKNKGIGEKVASCILLFAYSRFDVFPIDTWVKKYMKEKYDITDISKIKKFFNEQYGEYCGLVIQYIFNYNRNIKEKS